MKNKNKNNLLQSKNKLLEELQTSFLCARTLFYNKQYDDALKAYEKCITIQEKFNQTSEQTSTLPAKTEEYNFLFNILIKMAECHQFLKQYDDAIDKFNKALERSPYRLDIHLELMRAYCVKRDDKNAKIHAKKIIEAEPEKRDSYHTISNQKLNGVPNYEKLLKETYRTLGFLAREERSFEKARSYFEKANDLEELMNVTFILGDYENSAAYAQKVLKKATTAAPLDPKKAIIAHNYWALSLIHQYENYPPEMKTTQEFKIKLALRNLEDAVELINKNRNVTGVSEEETLTICNLAQLLSGQNIVRDISRAINLYLRAGDLGDTVAWYNLTLISETLENLSDARAYFKKAANAGVQRAQINLARSYLFGIEGSSVNLIKAESWARTALKVGNKEDAKYYLACILYYQSKEKPSAEVFNLLSELTELANASACHFLGAIYHDLSEFTLAEKYYLQAIGLGNEDAYGNLLSIYLNRLENDENWRNQNFNQTISTIREFCIHLGMSEDQIPDRKELLNFLKGKRSEWREFSFELNRELNAIYKDTDSTVDEKCVALLKKLDLNQANPVNLATIILKLGNLLDKSINGYQLFEKVAKQLLMVLETCEKKLNYFSSISLCNLITGISKFYRHGYSKELARILVLLYDCLLKDDGFTELRDFTAVIYAATRNPLASNILSKQLQDCIQRLEQHIDRYIYKKDDLSNLAYNLAMLANYRAQYPEFELNLNENLLQAVIIYAIDQINKVHLIPKIQGHQYFLALLYFSNKYPHLFKPNIKFDLAGLATQFQPDRSNISKIQNRIFSHIKTLFPDAKTEKVFNTFPVDISVEISAKDGTKLVIVQVDGPTHFVYVNENKDYARSVKDHLHDTLLKCKLHNNTSLSYKESQDESNIIIIHIDWQEYEKRGNSYIDEELKKQDITWPAAIIPAKNNFKSGVTALSKKPDSKINHNTHSNFFAPLSNCDDNNNNKENENPSRINTQPLSPGVNKEI